jgi:hypothetical protein
MPDFDPYYEWLSIPARRGDGAVHLWDLKDQAEK